ncbi:hypothetical protein AB0J80_12260 [Actinoplanes sp. NPDC049548]|uniref:hypothetical protein n=1 Tax=Actinoplanes sp. NPDC049548 TaxID=3155152 RepID=UPI003415D71D
MGTFDAEAVSVEVRESGLLESTDDMLVRSLRERGLSLVHSAIVLAKTRRISLSEAKEALADSGVWSAEFSVNRPVQDEIEGSLG